MAYNFKKLFLLLKEKFDTPTPEYNNFDQWRHETYEELKKGKLNNLPLKTWWPQYANTDFRLELCIGALLIQQVTWLQVRTCFEEALNHLKTNGKKFDIEGLLSISVKTFENLIKASRFPKKKSKGIIKFCNTVNESGGLDSFFKGREIDEFGKQLKELKCGFGSETRDAVLLYAANLPIFIADAYARKLLGILNNTQYKSEDYDVCREIFQEGIKRDFSDSDLEAIAKEYTPEELRYSLCSSPNKKNISFVLLYRQFHAGIVELGKSDRWNLIKS